MLRTGALSDQAAGRLEDERKIFRVEAVNQIVEFVGLRRDLQTEARCLAFQEPLFLGFDDRGIGLDGAVGRVEPTCKAGFSGGIQFVGLEFEPLGKDVEDLGRGDLGAVLDGRQVGVGDPGETSKPAATEPEVGADNLDGVSERFGPGLVILWCGSAAASIRE